MSDAGRDDWIRTALHVDEASVMRCHKTALENVVKVLTTSRSPLCSVLIFSNVLLSEGERMKYLTLTVLSTFVCIFFIEIEKLQVTMFDPNIVNLFFSDNAADAEVTGLEADFIWAPDAIEGLTVSGALSLLDTEITEVLLPTSDVREGDPLAYAPEVQVNLQARYEWSLDNGMTAHVMPHISYSDESYSDIIRMNRDRIDSWTMAGITVGVTTDTWNAEIFVDNLADERAEVSRNFVFDVQRVSYSRPRTMGLRMSYNF